METRYTLATWYTAIQRFSDSAILGVRFGELEMVNLGAGAELVALEFQVKTASSEAEFASGA